MSSHGSKIAAHFPYYQIFVDCGPCRLEQRRAGNYFYLAASFETVRVAEPLTGTRQLANRAVHGWFLRAQSPSKTKKNLYNNQLLIDSFQQKYMQLDLLLYYRLNIIYY